MSGWPPLSPLESPTSRRRSSRLLAPVEPPSTASTRVCSSRSTIARAARGDQPSSGAPRAQPSAASAAPALDRGRGGRPALAAYYRTRSDVTVVVPVHDERRGHADLPVGHRPTPTPRSGSTSSWWTTPPAAPSPTCSAEVRGLRVVRLDPNVGCLAEACTAASPPSTAPYVVVLQQRHRGARRLARRVGGRADTDDRIAIVGRHAAVRRRCAYRRPAASRSATATAGTTGATTTQTTSSISGRATSTTARRPASWCDASSGTMSAGSTRRTRPPTTKTVDLAFEARDRGWRVVFEPEATGHSSRGALARDRLRRHGRQSLPSSQPGRVHARSGRIGCRTTSRTTSTAVACP